nr:zinc finger, CCHC-type, retrotransposon Gag domain protein [Tanacetum cinerariifolium]
MVESFQASQAIEAYVATLSWKDFREAFFLQYFLRSEQQKYEREYHTIRQKDGELTGEFMKRFLRLAGFIGKKAGPPEEQAKQFKWAFSYWILDGTVNMKFMDRENDGRNYDRQCGNSSQRFINIFGINSTTAHLGLRDRRNTLTTLLLLHVIHVGNLTQGNGNDNRTDVKGKVYSLTRDQAANSSSTVTGTLFMHGRDVFVLFDTGATHSVISVSLSKYINVPPTLLNYTLSVSTPM